MDEIVRTLESSLKDLQVVVNKELDLVKAKQQLDVLAQQTADTSAKVAREVRVNVRKLMKLGSKVAREMKRPQSPQNASPQPSDQLSNVIKGNLSKIVALNKAVASLRNVRNEMLGRKRQISLDFAPLHEELSTAVEAIEASLSRAFNAAQVRVEANELNFQKELAKLRAGVRNTQSILQSIPDVLPTLDDKKIDFERDVGIYTRFANAKEAVHRIKEALAHLEMEKYAVSPEGVTQTRNALDNFDLVMEEEQFGHGDKASSQMEEPTGQVVILIFV
ncbi:unnamed protein product [Taenia asiatica]|uniref:t-SNARE coiled-coil homology domain-containing protein n=1 Tax=Taenia asiatica TaxID=60517 RepID=A0A0R3WEV2_TAEAS|nr:unnamed protein product [Taenia asiatica]